jgi:hypothetical protein
MMGLASLIWKLIENYLKNDAIDPLLNIIVKLERGFREMLQDITDEATAMLFHGVSRNKTSSHYIWTKDCLFRHLRDYMTCFRSIKTHEQVSS